MRRIYTLLFPCLLISVSAFAQSYEGFDYPAGSMLEGLNGGDDWSGAWVLTKGNDQTSIQAENIAVGDNASDAGHLRVVHEGAGGVRAFRRLPLPIADDGNTYYMSWYMDNDYDAPADNGSVAQVMITNGAALGAGGPAGQRVRMGKIFGTERFGVDGINVGGAAFIDGTDTREPIYVVAKISLSGDDGRDPVRIYINPDPEATELDDDAADLTVDADLNAGFDSYGFKVEGGAALTTFFDGFRFGRSLGDVSLPGVNIDQFNEYAAGEELAGQSGGIGWGGPWVSVSGDIPVIVDGGLDNFNTLLGSSGNSVTSELTGTLGDTRFFRPLNTKFEDDGSVYYFSYTQQTGYTDADGAAAFFMLIDSATYAPGGPGGQLAQIGKPQNTPFIGAGFGATGNFELTAADATDVHHVVVKVSMGGAGVVDTVSLFVNPTPGEPEPAVADAVKTLGRLEGGFDAIGFKVTGANATTLAFDDVMVGINYADVFAPDQEEVMPLTNAIAIETFNSYTGEADLNGLDGGTGWAGPWEAGGALDSSSIETTGLRNDALAVSTSGGSVRQVATGALEQGIRFLADPIDTTDNASFWFSAHLAVSGNIAGNVGNFILVDTTFGGQPNRVIVGKQFGSRNLFAVGQGTGPTQSGVQFEGTGARFVVGHMTRDTGRWNLDLFIDPDPFGGEPAEETANIINKRYNAGNFQAVSIRTDGGMAGLNWDVDDIYLGASFADVVPLDLEVIPPAPINVSESFTYDAGSSLLGADGGEGWAGPWRAGIDGVADGGAIVDDEGIVSVPLLKQTAGPKLNVADYQHLVRPLAGTYGDSGRDFWLGFWMDVDDAGANVVQFTLADTSAFGDGNGGGEVLRIGNIFNGGVIGLRPGGNFDGATAEDGHFYVAHIITDGTPADDQVFLWIDPALEGQPSEEDAAITATANLADWNGIGIKFDGNDGEPTQAFFDEIRIASAFADIVPRTSDVRPPDEVVPAVDLFEYAEGTELNGADGGEGWDGPWMAVTGQAFVASGNLESSRTCPEGNQLSLDQDGMMDPDSRVEIRRNFLNAFGTDEDSPTFYASFTLDVDTKDISNGGGFSLVDPGGDAILTVGGVGGFNRLAVVTADQQVTDNVLDVSGAKFFVVRMDINVQTGNAETFVFVDPVTDAIPSDANARFRLSNVNIGDGIAGVSLFGEGFSTISLLADDIRAGTSFRDVSCQFGSDDPDLLVYEPFNYDVGSGLEGLGGINAFWNGTWDVFESSVNEATIVAGSPEYPGYDPQANQSRFTYDTEGSPMSFRRDLAQTYESDGRTYWLSFFMNTTRPDQRSTVGTVQIINSRSSAVTGRLLGIGRLFGDGTLGTVVPRNNNTRKTDVPDEGINWLVLKLQTTGADAEFDTVSFWINPPVGPEPDTLSEGFLQMFPSPVFKDGFDQLELRTAGAGGYTTGFDELRLATSWSSARLTNTILVEPHDPFQLSAFPNPTSNGVTIRYDLKEGGRVGVHLYNLRGQLVRTLAEGERGAGEQRTTFAIGEGHLPNGIYLLRVVHNGRSTTRKLLLHR